MDSEIAVLRLLHIVPGVIWVGSVVFLAVILQPALAKAGPEHSAVVMKHMARPLTKLLHTSALLTIVIGVVMAFRVRPDGLFDVLWSTGWGWMIFAGLVLSVIGYASGTVSGLTSKKAGVLGASFAGRPPEPAEMAEMGRLLSRARITAQSSAALVTAAVVSMALARFV